MDLMTESVATSSRAGARRERWTVPIAAGAEPQGRTPRAVDLWVLHVDLGDPASDVASAAALLTDAERARAALGVPAVLRRRILMRAALRGLLGDILDVPPAVVPLSGGPGRPGLDGSAGGQGLDMSCTASGRVGLVVAARGGRVGVDVERIGAENLPTAIDEGWLAEVEQAAIARLAAGERPRALVRAWVQKEAVLKGEGTGLRADPAATVTPVSDRGRVGEWWLSPLDVPETHVASQALAPTS
jgi:4'-phosphopantetheinyl transferase